MHSHQGSFKSPQDVSQSTTGAILKLENGLKSVVRLVASLATTSGSNFDTPNKR